MSTDRRSESLGDATGLRFTHHHPDAEIRPGLLREDRVCTVPASLELTVPVEGRTIEWLRSTLLLAGFSDFTIEMAEGQTNLTFLKPVTLGLTEMVDHPSRSKQGVLWHTIETAPKDGTYVLIGWFEFPGQTHMDVAFWHGTHKAWCQTRAVFGRKWDQPAGLKAESSGSVSRSLRACRQSRDSNDSRFLSRLTAARHDSNRLESVTARGMP